MSTIHSKDGHHPPLELSELRHEIEQTRADLGATVEALATKADVKARAHEAVADVKARARETVSHAVDRATDGARSRMGRLVQSVREHPAPWVAGTVLVLIAAVLAPQRDRLAGPRSRRLAMRRLVRARAPYSGSRRWWR